MEMQEKCLRFYKSCLSGCVVSKYASSGLLVDAQSLKKPLKGSDSRVDGLQQCMPPCMEEESEGGLLKI